MKKIKHEVVKLEKTNIDLIAEGNEKFLKFKKKKNQLLVQSLYEVFIKFSILTKVLSRKK